MHVSKHERRVVLGAFLRESGRLRLTQKLAARLARVTPQALYAWGAGDRGMLRKSAGQLRAATLAMRECKGGSRRLLIFSTKHGAMGPFSRLQHRADQLREV